MYENVVDIIKALNEYFIYLYPGVISLFEYRFFKARKFEESMVSIIKCLVISYLYIIILKNYYLYYCGTVYDPKNAVIWDHVFLIAISIVAPYLFFLFSRSRTLDWFLKRLGISTNILNNPIDILLDNQKKERLKNKNIVLDLKERRKIKATNGIYLEATLNNGKKIDGSLINYQKDEDEDGFLIISHPEPIEMGEWKYKIIPTSEIISIKVLKSYDTKVSNNDKQKN